MKTETRHGLGGAEQQKKKKDVEMQSFTIIVTSSTRAAEVQRYDRGEKTLDSLFQGTKTASKNTISSISS